MIFSLQQLALVGPLVLHTHRSSLTMAFPPQAVDWEVIGVKEISK
jgi:hypothetical protein